VKIAVEGRYAAVSVGDQCAKVVVEDRCAAVSVEGQCPEIAVEGRCAGMRSLPVQSPGRGGDAGGLRRPASTQVYRREA